MTYVPPELNPHRLKVLAALAALPDSTPAEIRDATGVKGGDLYMALVTLEAEDVIVCHWGNRNDRPVRRRLFRLNLERPVTDAPPAAEAPEPFDRDRSARAVYAVIRTLRDPLGKSWDELTEAERTEPRQLAQAALGAGP